MDNAVTTPIAPVHLEPIEMGSLTATPWSFSPMWFIAIALGVPALAWLACAWKRALDEDPHRLRRRGRRELKRLLREVGRQGSQPAAIHLYAWTRATARTFGLSLSAPTPAQISSALQSHAASPTERDRWSDLWQSTERGLFAADAKPPADWLQQASSVANEVSIPKRQRWFPDRRRHWLPFLAIVLCLSGGTEDVAQAQQLAGDVQLPASADLEPVRVEAQQHVDRNWNDWAAHANVAAANLQQQKWNAAVAHGTVAFLQHPSSRAVQDNLRFALTQVQNADPGLHRLLLGTGYERLASWRSPAQWQRLALFGSLLVALGLSAAIVSLYLSSPRRSVLALRGSLVAGLVVLTVSLHGWSTYGKLADPRAGVLVQSIEIAPEPSDLAPREKMSPAMAGTVVQGRRAFLSWQQVRVRDDLTGWVRADALLPFYAGGAGTAR